MCINFNTIIVQKLKYSSLVPSKPTNLRATSTSSTSITVVWSAYGSVIDSYTVRWNSGERQGTGITQGTTLSHTIQGLEPGTGHTISVSASNVGGSAESDTIKTMTGII